jgi:hypothetical protein
MNWEKNGSETKRARYKFTRKTMVPKLWRRGGGTAAIQSFSARRKVYRKHGIRKL